jgi:hypothetical protein
MASTKFTRRGMLALAAGSSSATALTIKRGGNSPAPQPTGILFSDPQIKPLSATGQPQAGAYLLFFLTGTRTAADVYVDGLLTTPLSQTPGATQPSCTADSAGRFNPIYLNPATTYRVQMYTADGVKIEDADPYVPTGATPLSSDRRGISCICNAN